MHLADKTKSIDNHQIINAFYFVGMTGFEPATSRPPDDYYKSHYNLDYQCDAYLPFLYGLIHGLNRINRDSLTCNFHHKDNHNPLHHQHYRHRINYLPLFISMFQLTIYSSLLQLSIYLKSDCYMPFMFITQCLRCPIW